MKRVLFVCTGNTCRSSMAEAIAKKILSEKDKDGEIEFTSAGICALPGDRASHQAVTAMSECDIDLTGHKAKRIDQKLIDDADIILTMTSSHKTQILRMRPDVSCKVYTLSEFVNGTEYDIQDPFGQSVGVYRECAVELKEYIERAINKILDTVNG